jgi:HAMP domain-containing protein
MIRKLLFLVFAGIIVMPAMSQQIKVKEANRKIAKSNQPVLVATIYKADVKSVEKGWKKVVKEFNPEDFKSKKEMFADNAVIPSLSDNVVDIYAVAKKDGENVEFYVGVDLGGVFLNSSQGSKVEIMRSIVKEFVVNMTNEAYQSLVENQQKELEKVQREIESQTSDKEHLQKEIVSYQEKIENNNDEIGKITKELENQSQLLEKAQKKLEEIKKEASKVK